MTSTRPFSAAVRQDISRRRLAAGAAWTVPAVMVAGAAPARAASVVECTDTGLQRFPAPIQLFEQVAGRPEPYLDRFPYSADGWTARMTGKPFQGSFDFVRFGDRAIYYTLDPDDVDGAEVVVEVETTVATVPGCSYTVSSPYVFTARSRPRPVSAQFRIDGVASGPLIRSDVSPAQGTMTTAFAAVSTQTRIMLWMQAVAAGGTGTASDLQLFEPTVICAC